MLISACSSYVCSSGLGAGAALRRGRRCLGDRRRDHPLPRPCPAVGIDPDAGGALIVERRALDLHHPNSVRAELVEALFFFLTAQSKSGPSTSSRSEEHTSELQSLMRNSYAVF